MKRTSPAVPRSTAASIPTAPAVSGWRAKRGVILRGPVLVGVSRLQLVEIDFVAVLPVCLSGHRQNPRVIQGNIHWLKQGSFRPLDIRNVVAVPLKTQICVS